MSWMSQNYHIASLAGGALVLVGLGYMSKTKAGEVEENFLGIAGKKGSTTTVEGGEGVAETTKSLASPNPLTQKATSSGRKVDLFTSVDLFVQNGDASQVIDLLQEADIHPPIPNKWWVENRVDPSMSDAPQQDKDGDGFFNGEEHAVGSDPSDPKSHGDLATKLEAISVKSDIWFLDFSGVIGDGTQFKFQFKPAGGRVMENRIPASQQLAVNDFFYPKEPGLRRFKLLKVVEKEVQGKFAMMKRKFATVEDQRPNKLGDTYEIPYQVKKAEKPEFTFFDHTVSFRLNAVGEVGTVFEVEENGEFAIPQGSAEKSYKLLGVNLKEGGGGEAESVDVEYGPKDARKKINIPVN